MITLGCSTTKVIFVRPNRPVKQPGELIYVESDSPQPVIIRTKDGENIRTTLNLSGMVVIPESHLAALVEAANREEE